MKFALVLFLAALLGCNDPPPPPVAQPAAAVMSSPAPAPQKAPPVVVATPAPAPAPAPTPEPLADALPTDVASAIRLYQDNFGDQGLDDGLPKGGVQFAIWAQTYLKWADLQSLPASARALILKDSSEERGKKLCVTGTILEIEVEKTPIGKFAYAGILNQKMEVVSVIGVGSSGSLVERDQATFCGAVIGRRSYANSGGGVVHAVRVVGLFDLPENRRR